MKVSAAAVKTTGLKWKQIYKWMYDFHALERNRRNLAVGKPAKIFLVKRDKTRKRMRLWHIIKVPRAKKP